MSSTQATKPTDEQRAMEYYKLAAEYEETYRKLSNPEGNLAPVARDLQQASVKQLILGHALELTLKGWLVLREGTPVKSDRKAGVKGLKGYSHDLDDLAAATVKYYPELQNYIDGGVIALLNSNYFAGGKRFYEYPESTGQLILVRPLDKFADFVATCRATLLQAIMANNGGAVPAQYPYRTPSTGSTVQST